MSLYDTIALAFKNIRFSKVRTLLTVLGMVVGVSSVIVILGLGNGAQKYIANSFSQLGTRTMTIMLPEKRSEQSITSSDMYKIVEKNSSVLEDVSPIVPVKHSTILNNEKTKLTQVFGVSEDAPKIEGYSVKNGRDLCFIDVYNRAQVCLIGDYLDKAYFNGNGIGQRIQIGDYKFSIVGVLRQKTSSSDAGDANDIVYIPYTTALKLYGGQNETDYFITVHDESMLDSAKQLVYESLDSFFNENDEINIVTQSEILDTLNNTISMVVLVLSIVAGISLLVGGIGIMNIMLVTVAERTKEIGVRKAIGAKESAILKQFIIESGTISTLGGMLGIIAGYFLSIIASLLLSSYLKDSISVAAPLSAIFISFGVSAGTGIIFGVLPARKAASLDPIEALRFN